MTLYIHHVVQGQKQSVDRKMMEKIYGNMTTELCHRTAATNPNSRANIDWNMIRDQLIGNCRNIACTWLKPLCKKNPSTLKMLWF